MNDSSLFSNETCYVACASLEWKLDIHLSEWKAARNLAKRLGKDPIADTAYLEGVKDLLNDFLAVDWE